MSGIVGCYVNAAARVVVGSNTYTAGTCFNGGCGKMSSLVIEASRFVHAGLGRAHNKAGK